MKESDVKLYYPKRYFINRLYDYLSKMMKVQTKEERIKLYADMISEINPNFVKKFLCNMDILEDNKKIKLKNSQFWHQFQNELKSYSLISYEIVRGVSTNKYGVPIWYTAFKYEPVSQEETLEQLSQKKGYLWAIQAIMNGEKRIKTIHYIRSHFYNQLNLAIMTGNIKVLQENIEYLENNYLYHWVIDYYHLSSNISLKRQRKNS